jgi:hypothetical protein
MFDVSGERHIKTVYPRWLAADSPHASVLQSVHAKPAASHIPDNEASLFL